MRTSVQAEAFVQPTGGQSVVGDYTPGTLGSSGPILLSLPNHNTTYYTKVTDIARDKSVSGTTYNADINSGTPLGLGELLIRTRVDNCSYLPLLRLVTCVDWRRYSLYLDELLDGLNLGAVELGLTHQHPRHHLDLRPWLRCQPARRQWCHNCAKQLL